MVKGFFLCAPFSAHKQLTHQKFEQRRLVVKGLKFYTTYKLNSSVVIYESYLEINKIKVELKFEFQIFRT